MLPTSNSDHLALEVKGIWGCLCGLDNLPVPSCSGACSQASWQPGLRRGEFYAALSYHDWSRKEAVVAIFEQLGSLMGQPLAGDSGLRLFGGHTPRVTGAQAFAAMGVEVNKNRILARRSGDTILRYVADAPLRSLRADLGLCGGGKTSSSSSASFSAGSSAATPDTAPLSCPQTGSGHGGATYRHANPGTRPYRSRIWLRSHRCPRLRAEHGIGGGPLREIQRRRAHNMRLEVRGRTQAWRWTSLPDLPEPARYAGALCRGTCSARSACPQNGH